VIDYVRAGPEGKYARSENRTRTGCPTRPSNVRVYQFRHPSLKRTCNYFAGEAAGLGEASGLAAAAGEVAGDAAGLAGGAAAGAETGVGVGVAEPSSTTEWVPIPGSEKISARSIKSTAATTVAFSSGFWAPRGPNAVWLPDPPKAAATSPPFPDCKRTTRIRNRQTITKITLRAMNNKATPSLNVAKLNVAKSITGRN
jgi:hypothetical protein